MAWYYRHEPRPGVTVIGDRLLELAFGGPQTPAGRTVVCETMTGYGAVRR
jgi:hypothetical protein